MRRLSVVALVLAFATSAAAQRSGFSGFSGRPGGSFFRSGFRSSFYPFGAFDPFYANSFSRPEYPSGPPVVILQPPESFPGPAEPVLIELQGDRYVRVSGEENSTAQVIDKIPSPRPSQPAVAPSPSRPLWTPTVLVFLDGHREEVSNYTITSGILYASRDYYTSGSWIRKIDVALLNLPATVNSNQSHGVRFQVPSAPNEVIVGP